MRLSVNKNDKGYDPTWPEKEVDVYCNGKLIRSAITADEEEGFVLAYDHDADGSIAIGIDDEGEAIAKTIRYYGKVEIRSRDNG